MGRLSGNNPMFDEEDIRRVTDPGLPRLARQIFFGESITNEGYLSRYNNYHRGLNQGDKTQKEYSQKAAADRKTLNDPRKLTFNMLRSVLVAMGYDIESVSVRLHNQMTGETRTYSTDDTIEDLLKIREADSAIGVSGLE